MSITRSGNNMKKVLILFSIICVCTIAEAQVHPKVRTTNHDNLLYEGIYTETGRFYVNDVESEQFIISTSFYVKIYSNKLIVTAISHEKGIPVDYEYGYSGCQDGYRTYSLSNGIYHYQVDDDYDITKVMEIFSMQYGANIKDSYCYETIKGEHADEYNKKHGTDIKSMREQLYGPIPL